MEVRELTLMIGTDQPEALARFYGEVLGLERLPQYRDPVFRAAGANIRILAHSGIAGRTSEPARLQINLFVADVRTEWERIAAQGVRFVRGPGGGAVGRGGRDHGGPGREFRADHPGAGVREGSGAARDFARGQASRDPSASCGRT